MSKPVALVVEDEALIRMVVSAIAEDAGFEVIGAHDGDAAMLVLRGRSDIAVMLTDVAMPGTIDGFSLARTVRQHWPEIEVIVASGEAAPQGRIAEGCRFLAKPFDVRD